MLQTNATSSCGISVSTCMHLQQSCKIDTQRLIILFNVFCCGKCKCAVEIVMPS